MDFAPIAIVGQGCVLPSALSPAELWELVRLGRSAIGEVPAGEWRLDPAIERRQIDREVACRMAGQVRGFDAVWDPRGFQVDVDALTGLDPVFTWTLHAAREAVRSAGLDPLEARPRGAVVLGNLSFPVPALIDFAVDVWRDGGSAVDPRNRFMSGLPAQLVAAALGFGAGGFCLDAACASSLYAIKLACDRLHDGRADLALAGGVNHADDLFLHLGFTALSALSPTGRSRPFHRAADGLVPAHGAAVVLLKRLADAEADGDRILAVIRGVGVVNDGRGRGLLVPVDRGQVRAMQAAYAASGIAPREISLVECHATGTAVGDAVELRSMREVFAGVDDLPVGSLKSNLGHLITASGAAALLKVIAAMAAEIRPASLHADEPLDELAAGPFRVLAGAEPWHCDGPRRAAISNFGFGGNNSHLVVEQWQPRARPRGAARPARAAAPTEIAVIAQEVTAAGADGGPAFEAALFERGAPGGQASSPVGSIAEFELDAMRLRFPPSDLDVALAQQTLLCHTVLALGDVIARLPRERTSVLVGMQCDAEIARCSLRWRRRDAEAGRPTAGPLDAGVVLGCMPNVVANRLNSAFDLCGPSFTVSADEASGTVALDLALRGLAAGEIDAAVVCAVDLCCEPVQRAAAEAVLPAARRTPGDAAVVLVVKRLDDARRDGDPVLAVLAAATRAPAAGDEVTIGVADADRLAARFGHAHAAAGLLQVAAAVASCARRAIVPGPPGSPAVPWLPAATGRHTRVAVDALGGARTATSVRDEPGAPPLRRAASVQLAAFAADDVDALAAALEARAPASSGSARIAVVAASDDELAARIARAARWLREPGREREPGEPPDGVHFGCGPAGELAFVFTGPAGAYPGMGRDLLLDLPDLVDGLARRMPGVRDAAGWLYRDGAAPGPADKLWASSFLAQAHAELTRGLLGIAPAAAIGYCSGETNALFALGAWQDLDGFRRAITDSGIYDRELAGELRCVRRAWGVDDGGGLAWTALRVLADAAAVRDALAGEPRVHLTIRNTERDVVIAGDRDGCARVAARLGAHRTRPLDYDLVMHCPEARPLAARWRELHRRDTTSVPVRFYTHATGASYAPTADAVADALTEQAMNPIDVPALIERAYRDGVRVFVEHGPHAGYTRWIDDVLGARPHVAVALDRFGRSSAVQAVESIARLFAAGVAMDIAALTARLSPPRRQAAPARLTMRLAAHMPPVRFADATAGDEVWEVMAPAPPLPPVLAVAAVAVAPPSLVPLAAVHAAFLRQQAAAHAEFLRLLIGAPGDPPVSTLAAPPPPAAPPAPSRAPSPPTGPAFDRADLETLASGQISSLFGPQFAAQDGYARQVRMPEPPLLLVDRVLGIAGAPGEMGRGTIWTETDIDDDAWYLHAGRMPAGILVEAGQADLLLISWLGADAHNRGERVYRLLGCELTSHGELPRPGDRLRYEIHVDGHARQGDIRLFFFHYDCWVNGELRMTVRGGQAGFFSDAELAATAGVLWDPGDAAPTQGARCDPPAVACRKHALTPADIAAFVDGRADACFGPGFERLSAHTRTPAIQRGRMLLLDEVTRLELDGGPWRRGYLRAELALRSDHWFFAGHFKGDPCMPGTLMFEGCLQALATYLVALGFTLDRDGWRFEPVADHTYSLRCRGQAVPTSQRVVYEVFVDEVIAAPYPTIFADLLGTVDGVRAFHCRRMGLRLVPDYLLDDRAADTADLGDAGAMLACAWGRPSRAFGDRYRGFDGPCRVPRLPGPPYHFMSRVTRVDGAIGERRVGSRVEAEYVVPADAWYFADNDARMPYCVLLEIALQPCGWLASYAGCALIGDTDRALRNLDGTGVVHRELGRDAGTLTTRATLVSLSIAAGIVVVGFDVAVRAGDSEVMTARTVFGLFDADSLKHQVGLPADDSAGDARGAAPGAAPGVVIDLARRAGPYFAGTLRLPTGRLLMLDRITALDPTGGAAGLGRIRAEKDVWPGDWFFRAHFFQDPVQPGSLGLDAMLQALEVLMIERGMAADIAAPRFEAVAADIAMTWKYRGQIVPENRRIAIDVAITRETRDAAGALAEARGSLYVDGKRIYEASGLAVRIVASHDHAATASFDPAAARRFWREATAMPGPWAGEDLMFALLARFVGDVHIAAALPRRARRGVVYLANHQVAIESLMAALVIGGLTETIPVLVAKAEHRHSWLGALIRLLADCPGFRDPDLLRFVDRGDPASVLRQRDRLVGELAAGRSVVVHVEGTRATSCRPVSVISAAFVDLALEVGADIVPLRFTGGLPVAGAARLEFPVGLARQDHWFGRPIAAGELRDLPLAARLEHVCRAINALGPPADAEVPAPPAPEFAARVAGVVARGVPEPRAVLRAALAERAETAAELSPDGRAICAELTRRDAGARPDTRPWWAALAGWLCGDPGRSPADDRVAAHWGNERR